MSAPSSALPCSERLKRVNELLQSRYEKHNAPEQTTMHETRAHEKAVVVHRLDAALADVQSKLSVVKAHPSTLPLGMLHSVYFQEIPSVFIVWERTLALHCRTESRCGHETS